MNNDIDHGSMGAGPRVARARFSSRRYHKDPQSFKWSKVIVDHDSILPAPRSGAGSVVVQGKLYMFGGYGGGTGRLDDFYSYDFLKQTWEEVEIVGEDNPGCRENNGVVISDSRKSIYLFGGYDGSAWLNDLWKFDIETKRWCCIQNSSDLGAREDMDTQYENDEIGIRGKKPSRRFGCVSVVHNNKLVIFGGFDGARWLNDMYVFNFETEMWTEVYAKGELPSLRSCPAWVADDSHCYIQGGYDGVERKDDFFACDLSTYTWTQMPSLGNVPSPRYFHSCCLYGNKMYLYGGYSGSQRLDDMYAYDFDTNSWASLDVSSGEIPCGRSSLVMQVYENHMYVYGGYDGSTVLNDFYKFRLAPLALPPSALKQDFERLLNEPELSDVCFIVEGKRVFGHRAILAIRSEYFRVLLFNGHMRESVQSRQADFTSGGHENAIPLHDVSHSVFLKVLEFLYTDTVCDVSLELGMHLLMASEQFMLDRLKVLCEDIIRRNIYTSNVITILVASHQHNAIGLKEIAMEFILSNLNEKDIQKGLSDLKATPELLVEIIQLSSSTSIQQTYPQSSEFRVGPTSPRQENTAFLRTQQPRNMMDQAFQPELNDPFDHVNLWRNRGR